MRLTVDANIWVGALDVNDPACETCRACLVKAAEKSARLYSPVLLPVEVAASGPKVIAMAALHGDRVMFTVGADVERLHWGIELARHANLHFADGGRLKDKRHAFVA